MKNCALSAHVSKVLGSVNSFLSKHQVSGTGSCLCLGWILICVIFLHYVLFVFVSFHLLKSASCLPVILVSSVFLTIVFLSHHFPLSASCLCNTSIISVYSLCFCHFIFFCLSLWVAVFSFVCLLSFSHFSIFFLPLVFLSHFLLSATCLCHFIFFCLHPIFLSQGFLLSAFCCHVTNVSSVCLLLLYHLSFFCLPLVFLLLYLLLTASHHCFLLVASCLSVN